MSVTDDLTPRFADVDDDGFEPPKPIKLNRFKITLHGTQPLLMHNSRLVDPFDPIVRELVKITSKRKKTDADHEAVARLEFLGGLYHDKDLGPYLPAYNIERALVHGARITRSGRKIERGVFIAEDPLPVLAYRGPRDPEKLWDARADFLNRESVVISGRRIMRARPMFRDWAVEAEGTYDPEVINLGELAQIATTTGMMVGIGDFRTKYGHFVAAVEPLTEQ